MEGLELVVDPAWTAGLLVSMTRVAAFVLSSPLMGRGMPMPARVTTTLALGLFFSAPFEAAVTVPNLLGATVMNAAVGISLGYLTGILFQLFPVAGGIIDMTSGMSAATILDPVRGEQGAVFNRLFAMGAVALFYVTGGLLIVVRGLALSVEAIPLDGSIAPAAGLATVAGQLTSRMMLAGAELALPVVAVLFLTEVVLGLAARFAPQMNVFLLGLPAKIFVAITTSSLALLLFPETMSGVLDGFSETFVDAIRGLAGGATL